MIYNESANMIRDKKETTMISTKELSKTYGKKVVVNRLNLTVKKGEIYGLLGPNGAGKTTVMKMLATLLEPSSGEVEIMGIDAKKEVFKIRGKIGYVSQYFGLYEELSVRENIEFYASLYNANEPTKITNLIKKYDLERFETTMAKELSGGTQRRLSLVCALTHEPKLLFLDEPTAGVDPVTRKELWDNFFELRENGVTIIVSTHYMEEALRCDKLVFMSRGDIVANDSVENIMKLLDNNHIFSLVSHEMAGLSRKLKNNPNILFTNQFGDELRIVAEKSLDLEAIKKLLKFDDVKISKASLEEVFIALTRDRK